MRVLIPADLGSRLDELRSASARVEAVTLRVDRQRPPWARAVEFVSRRWLPSELYRSLRPALAGSERLSLRVDGAPLDPSNGGEILLATWPIDARTARIVIDAMPGLRSVELPEREAVIPDARVAR